MNKTIYMIRISKDNKDRLLILKVKLHKKSADAVISHLFKNQR